MLVDVGRRRLPELSRRDGPLRRRVRADRTRRPASGCSSRRSPNDPDPTLPSVVPLWKGADWMEREVYDMYGIVFDGHPDLRRILMPDEFTALPAAQGLPAARPRRAAQLPGHHAGGELSRRSVADANRMTRLRHARREMPCRQTARRRSRRGPTRSTSGRSTSARSTRPRTPRCGWSSRSTARRIVKAVPDIGYLHSRLREARRGPRLQPVRHHRRPDELHLAGRQRGGLAPRGREAAGHRAHAALQVHPHDLRRAGADSATTCSASARRRSTSGRSPRSCTPSISAR